MAEKPLRDMAEAPLIDDVLETTNRVEREPEYLVVLDDADVLYEDALPMSDVLVAPSGGTCCLRRIPDRAEVVAWESAPGGQPASWTGPPSIPLIALIGFDGEQVFGRTESALLLIRRDRIETLYETKSRIGTAALSAEAGALLWTERNPARLCSMRVREDTRVREASLPRDCTAVQATWLSGDEILASLILANGGSETGMALVQWTADLESSSPLATTRAWVFHSMTAASPQSFFLHGARRDASGPRDRQSAVWLVALQPLTFTCVGRGRTVGGTSARAGDTCLFADAWQQTAVSSTLVAASLGRTRVANVPEFLREFCLSGDWILFCTRGDRFSIRTLSVRGLTVPHELRR